MIPSPGAAGIALGQVAEVSPKVWMTAIVAAVDDNAWTDMIAFGGEGLVQGGVIPNPTVAGKKPLMIDRIGGGGAGNFAVVGANVSAFKLDRGPLTEEQLVLGAAAGDLTTGAVVTGHAGVRIPTTIALKQRGVRYRASMGGGDTTDLGQIMSVLGCRYSTEQPAAHIEYVSAVAAHTTEVTPTPLTTVADDVPFPFEAVDVQGIRQWGISMGYDGDQAADVATGVILDGDGIMDKPQRLPGPVASSGAAAAAGANIPATFELDEWIATQAGLISPSAVAGPTASDLVIAITLGLQRPA